MRLKRPINLQPIQKKKKMYIYIWPGENSNCLRTPHTFHSDICIIRAIWKRLLGAGNELNQLNISAFCFISWKRSAAGERRPPPPQKALRRSEGMDGGPGGIWWGFRLSTRHLWISKSELITGAARGGPLFRGDAGGLHRINERVFLVFFPPPFLSFCSKN